MRVFPMNDSLLVNSHISEYVRTLIPDLPVWLAEVECAAKEKEVPIIRKEAQGLLRFLLRSHMPENILEIGTAVGFSASFMADCMNYRVQITTIEKDETRIAAAEELFASREQLKDHIRLIPGDAGAVLSQLTAENRKYDLIFLDSAKAQYPSYLEEIRKLLNEGGLLVTDNILQEGSLADSKFTVTRRDRTIHMRLREFTEILFNDPLFTSVLLPVGDGMTVSVYRAD